jgi:hypothetical protein
MFDDFNKRLEGEERAADDKVAGIDQRQKQKIIGKKKEKDVESIPCPPFAAHFIKHHELEGNKDSQGTWRTRPGSLLIAYQIMGIL